jgi:hypothetical protein
MARAPRLNAPLAVHHVWNRITERCAFFRDDVHRLDFLIRVDPFVRAEHFALYALGA